MVEKVVKVLAKFCKNWADEFDQEGFTIYTPEEWEIQKKALSEPRSFDFGTNEGWEDEVFINSVTTQEITDEEADILYRLFPELNKQTHEYEYLGKKRTFSTGGEYGTFPYFNIEENEE